MFGQSSRPKRSTEEASRPLLDTHDEQVVFTVDDDSDEDLPPPSSSERRPEHSVRFEDHVQVIGPPLKSTVHSRETGVSCELHHWQTY